MSERRSPAAKKLAEGAAWLTINSLAEGVAFVLLFAIAARMLTVSEVGIMSFGFILGTLTVAFASFALPQAAIHFIAKHKSNQNHSAAKEIFNKVTAGGLLLGTTCAIVLSLSGETIAVIFEMYSNVFFIQIVALDILPSMMIQVLTGGLMGVEKFRSIGLAGLMGVSLKSGIAFSALLVGYGLNWVALAWLIGDVLWCILLAKDSIAIFTGQNLKVTSWSDIGSFSAPLYISNIIDNAMQNLDQLIILSVFGSHFLGLYTPVVAGIMMLTILVTSITRPLLPRLTHVFVQNDAREATHYIQRASKWTMLVIAPLAFGLAIEAPFFLLLIAGPSYQVASLPLAVISIAFVAASQYYVVRSVAFGLGETKTLFMSNMIALSVNITLLALLVGPLDILGAAIARGILFCIQFALPLILLRKISHNIIDFSPAVKPVVAAIAMLLFIIPLQLVLHGPILLFIQISGGVFAYLIALRLLHVLDTNDFIFIRSVIPNSMHKLVAYLESFLKP